MNEFTIMQPPEPNQSYIEIGELIAQWEKDPIRKAELDKARTWFKENFKPWMVTCEDWPGV